MIVGIEFQSEIFLAIQFGKRRNKGAIAQAWREMQEQTKTTHLKQ